MGLLDFMSDAMEAITYREMLLLTFILFVAVIIFFILSVRNGTPLEETYGGGDAEEPPHKFIKKALQFRSDDSLNTLLAKGKKKFDIRSKTKLFTDTKPGDVLVYYSESHVIPVRVKDMKEYATFEEALKDTPSKEVFGKELELKEYSDAFQYVTEEKKLSGPWIRFELSVL